MRGLTVNHHLRRAEQDPTILGSSANPVHILAFCSGQLAAVPLIAAKDTADLLPISREIISVCVRYISLTQQRRMDLLAPHETGAWFTTYLGLRPERVQTILDEFHVSNKLSRLQKISIGVVSEGWLTLVGTPSSFARLAAWSPEIRDAPHIPTDVGGPSHTPFMPIPDVSEMVGSSPVLDCPIDWSKAIMSDPSGDVAPYQHATLRDLLGHIIVDILERPLRIDKSTKICTDRLRVGPAKDGSDFNLKLHEMGKTPHLSFVQKMLKSANLKYELAPPRIPSFVDPNISMSRGSSDQVAIVGMSGRFPDNESVDGFWEDLLAGTCHIKKIPKSRFDVDRYYDATHKLKNSTAAREGGWLPDPGLFDNRFFNISPREAMQLDPVARLALTTTHEALEMAGYSPGATPSTNPDRVATFFGITGMDWTENLHQQGLDIYAVSSIAKAFITGRLNYTYKFGRGCYSLDAACASSTTAITLGVQGLISRDCDMAVAGGASVFSSPFAFSALSRSGMLAFEGGCRTFHDDADGYARSEGVGMVVLKRLEDAVADNDNILGVIRGAARSYSTTSTSITHPSHVSQEKVFREVLGQTAVDPEEISFVEMHGTGTQAGDFEEMTSVLNVVGGHRNANNPLTVGAVKAAVGHGEGVAGVISLIKSLMMLKHGKIPPQPGAPFKVNSKFPRLDKRNVRIALEQSRLQASPKAKDSKIRMLVNSFDASGGNCSLVLEEAPTRQNIATRDPRTSHLVAFSARTAISLQKNCERLLGYLERNPSTRLEDLAYTTTARRMHESLRVAFVASSVEDVKRQLADHINSSANQGAIKKPKVPRVVFLFTGQGSQYTAMGRTLYQTNKSFRDVLETYQVAVTALELPEFLPIISDNSFDSSTASPVQVQLAIVALELAVSQVLRTWGIAPDVVIGHSLGEYAALCASGVLSPSDALYLVGRRAQLMEQRLTPDTHAMLATMMGVDDLNSRIKNEQTQGAIPSCSIACVNSPVSTVASGSMADITVLKDKLAGDGIRSTLLRVPFGFHSAQVEPVLPELEQLAASVVFNKPIVPIVSSLTGQLVTESGVFDAHYLARQAREPVNFVGAQRSAETAGFTGDSSLWVEVGPDPVLLGLARKTLDIPASRLLPAFKQDRENWTTLAAVLKTAYENGMAIQWPVYHREFVSSLNMLPDLPSYAWDYKDYWIPYTSPPAWEVEKALTGVQDHYGNGSTIGNQQQRLGGVLPSTALHRLEEEKVDDAAGTMQVVFASETDTPSLRKAIEGHVVNGHKITPLGLFCEMAFAASKYCYLRMSKDASADDLDATKMSLENIALHHPVILDGSASPIILTTSTYSATSNTANVVFHSKAQPSSTSTPVGECVVTFAAPDKPTVMTPAQTQTVYLIKARIEQLRSLVTTGQAHRLLRPVVYSLFSSYVKYGPSYHAMDEVVLSNDSQDAVASITAPVTDEKEKYVCNPYLYDGVTHLAGFVVNNGLRFDDPQVICIADGFSNSCVWEPLVAGRKYTTYVSLHEVSGSEGRFEGSCYIFDAEGGQLVGLYSGFRFQKMKKAVLDYVMGGAAKSASHSQPPAPTTRHRPATSNEPNIVDRVFAIAAAEVGCSTKDMTNEANFADLGIDSLLAIAVLSRCKNELDLDLPATFFLEHETVGAARQTLAEQQDGLSPCNSSSDSSDDELAIVHTPAHSLDEVEKHGVVVLEKEQEEEAMVRVELAKDGTTADVEQVSAAMSGPELFGAHDLSKDKVSETSTSIHHSAPQAASQCKIAHLQGPETASTTLFLFADKSGSSANYSQLPILGPQLSVYGVDWPTAPSVESEGTRSIEALVAACASSIRAHVNLSSRVILGGVDVGSVIAVEVGRLLDNVAGVLALDPSAASTDAITRTRDRLKRMRILRPAQEKNMTLARELMSGYTFPPVDSSKVEVVAIVPKAEGTNAGSLARNWFPGADIRGVDVLSESFLKKPGVSIFLPYPPIYPDLLVWCFEL